jgi:hypothetical protein
MDKTIHIVDDSENESVKVFLSDIIETDNYTSETVAKFKHYLTQGQSNLDATCSHLKVHGKTPHTIKPHKLRSPDAIDGLSASIAAACVYGASKYFVEILKIWVDERKGRKLRIIKGDKEIHIEGGVTKKKVKEIIRLIDSEFEKSKDHKNR